MSRIGAGGYSCGAHGATRTACRALGVGAPGTRSREAGGALCLQTGWGCEQGARSVVSGIRSCVVRLRGGTEAGVRPRDGNREAERSRFTWRGGQRPGKSLTSQTSSVAPFYRVPAASGQVDGRANCVHDSPAKVRVAIQQVRASGRATDPTWAEATVGAGAGPGSPLPPTSALSPRPPPRWPPSSVTWQLVRRSDYA